LAEKIVELLFEMLSLQLIFVLLVFLAVYNLMFGFLAPSCVSQMCYTLQGTAGTLGALNSGCRRGQNTGIRERHRSFASRVVLARNTLMSFLGARSKLEISPAAIFDGVWKEIDAGRA
jgi:hypothetical protein